MVSEFPKLPVASVVFLVMQALAGGFWLASLSSRVATLESFGSPNAIVAVNQLAVIGGKLSNIELSIPQIASNSNRLTKLETEFDTLQHAFERELESRWDRHTPSYLRGEFTRRNE